MPVWAELMVPPRALVMAPMELPRLAWMASESAMMRPPELLVMPPVRPAAETKTPKPPPVLVTRPLLAMPPLSAPPLATKTAAVLPEIVPLP